MLLILLLQPESPAEKVAAPDKYWAELLKGRVEAAQASKRDDLGQVRRSRRTISYSTLVDSDKETSDSSFKHHSSSESDGDFEAAFEVERFPAATAAHKVVFLFSWFSWFSWFSLLFIFLNLRI